MTTIGIKQDADLILSHLRSLKDTSWIAESQSRWPDFLYHFTDIHNAIEILRKGELICRSELESTGSLATDIASPEVISSTSDRWKDYVRFYFRPKTPTQYRNEGFRPRNQRELGGAHCPVPIFFLFDIKPIVSREETKFSDGNLAADANVDSTAAFFTSLPFEKIYHERSLWGLDEGEKRKIIFHRHAEVIVPQAVELLMIYHSAFRF